MIQGKDFIVTGIIHWDLPVRSNCQDIALEISQHNRVLYIYYPLNTSTASNELASKRKEISRSTSKGLVQVNENLNLLYTNKVLLSANWLPRGIIFSIINFLNAIVFAKEVKKITRKLGFKNYVLFNDTSMFLGLHLKRLLKPAIYIYYMRDNMIKVPFWAKHGLKIEPKVIAKADLIVNNSDYYAAYGRKYNPHSYMVGQGCDVSSFDELKNNISVPDALLNISKPIIGYIGTVWTLRLEIEIIQYIAENQPDWSIVLVGPEDENFKKSSLHQLSNVYFMGSVEMKDVPGWIKGFDVAINPQLVNDITIGNYPRKIDEYLAMGKAIVATKTEAMSYFADWIYLAENKEDYIKLIKKAMEEDCEELKSERKKIGKSHSWKNNINEIYKYIELVASEKNLKI